MNVVKLTARVECDGCGKHFDAPMDTGRAIPVGWDLPALIEDAVRGGCGELSGSTSVQHDLALCVDCTRKADAIGDDDEYQPTRDEILRATMPGA